MNNPAHSGTPSYQITCHMDNEAAALERLCQVIRIRGFTIEKMHVDLCDQAQLSIQLTLRGERAISMLQSQLEKLHTVNHVDAQQRQRARHIA